jgi:hypothetical protein
LFTLCFLDRIIELLVGGTLLTRGERRDDGIFADFRIQHIYLKMSSEGTSLVEPKDKCKWAWDAKHRKEVEARSELAHCYAWIDGRGGCR